MPEYLVGICYHEPEPFALWQRGVIEDYESSTGLWVTAESPDEAIAWGEQVGEALHRNVNGDPNADWRADYSCWLEKSPATSCWAHCLNFFQRVRVGEMPPLDRMGTEAYVRWQEQRHAKPSAAAAGAAIRPSRGAPSPEAAPAAEWVVRRRGVASLTEAEWLTCDFPYDMLRHLDGKIDDEAFMRFSVACCRRIWALISDPRSRAVVEATEAYLAGTITAEAAAQVCAEWDRASQAGEVEDRAGGHTEEAIEAVYGLGYCNAATVVMACFESAGYAVTEPLRVAGVPRPEITAAWKAAEFAERRAQCRLLRELFGYRSTKGG